MTIYCRMDYESSNLSSVLAQNLIELRSKRNYSQQVLSNLSKIPRSTIAHLESGLGNPTLFHMTKIAAALEVSVEELLQQPRPTCLLKKASEFEREKKNKKGAFVYKLLPDPIPGTEIDRMEIPKNIRFPGVPHTSGTKEYFVCEKGQVTVYVAGETYVVNEGDLLAFPGDQAHAYHNKGNIKAICYSVVVRASFIKR
ncbi:MAG: helix-turn-helix domain-containing protein [Oligoflexia bacterium]|nr:helix-turn-helix domain-containing protein [Oligoflexia bacterium]